MRLYWKPKLGIAAVLSASLLAGGCTPVYMTENIGKAEASSEDTGKVHILFHINR